MNEVKIVGWCKIKHVFWITIRIGSKWAIIHVARRGITPITWTRTSNSDPSSNEEYEFFKRIIRETTDYPPAQAAKYLITNLPLHAVCLFGIRLSKPSSQHAVWIGLEDGRPVESPRMRALQIVQRWPFKVMGA
jgi:hypothetical protein